MRPQVQAISRLFTFLLIFVTSVALACNSPLSNANQDAIGTSAAQTITAEFNRQTETASAGPTSTATTIPTQAPQVPTSTLPPSAVALPTNTQAPPPPSGPTISASEDTNCREGPAPEYPRLGYLLKDETSQVVGRHSQNTWWYIKNPRNANQNCWVWGETTHVSGDTSSLPVITPPPPPVGVNPSFRAFFAGLNNCGGPTVIFEIQNIGDATFKSMELNIEDLTLDELVHSSSRNSPFFANPGGCPGGGQNLEPRAVKYIGGLVENFVNSGDHMGAEINLCTEQGLAGDCVSTYVTFTFP